VSGCKDWEIDHLPYRGLSVGSKVTMRSRSVANTDTRFEPNILGRGCLISYGALFERRAR